MRIVFVIIFGVVIGLSDAFARDGYNRKDIQAGESFAFHMYNRVIIASAQKSDASDVGNCGSVVVMTTGSTIGPILISNDELNEVIKLPKQLQMSSISFTCKELNNFTVTW